MKSRFLEAANWVLENEANGIETGIRTARISGDGYQLVLFNQRKNLLYEGFSHPNQLILKGLICRVENNKAVEVVSACFDKFFNFGEPSEKNKYFDYTNHETTVHFLRKYDGSNIRPYWDSINTKVQFATRGTLTGSADFDEENTYVDYGRYAFDVASEKYPILLQQDFVKRYSCIFELIHPGTRVITNYGDVQNLILLTVFDLQEDKELSFDELKVFAKEHHLSLMETWDVGIQEIQGTYFQHHLDALQEKWQGTDEEGAVIMFCNQDSEILYRLKFKNKDYIAFLRALKNCNFKFVVTTVLENKLTEWESFKEFVYKNAFANEEVEPRFKELFEYAQKYYHYLEAQKMKLELEYGNLPDFYTQKEFALHIVSHPHKSFFFEFRKALYKGVSIAELWDIADSKGTLKLYRMLQEQYPYKNNGNIGLFDFEFEKGLLV